MLVSLHLILKYSEVLIYDKPAGIAANNTLCTNLNIFKVYHVALFPKQSDSEEVPFKYKCSNVHSMKT